MDETKETVAQEIAYLLRIALAIAVVLFGLLVWAIYAETTRQENKRTVDKPSMCRNDIGACLQ